MDKNDESALRHGFAMPYLRVSRMQSGCLVHCIKQQATLGCRRQHKRDRDSLEATSSRQRGGIVFPTVCRKDLTVLSSARRKQRRENEGIWFGWPGNSCFTRSGSVLYLDNPSLPQLWHRLSPNECKWSQRRVIIRVVVGAIPRVDYPRLGNLYLEKIPRREKEHNDRRGPRRSTRWRTMSSLQKQLEFN